VFLEEFTTAGGAVQTIAVPATGAGALTVNGTATTEGILTLSQDGSRIVLTGYRKDAGGTNPVSDLPTTTNRVIATLMPTGTLDTTIDVTDTTGTIRSASTVSGSSFYLGTSTSVRYVASATADTTSTAIDPRNSRQVQLSGGVLYASNGSTAITNKVQHYGTSPTVTTVPTAVVTLATADAVNGFWLANLNAAIPGDDTIYVTSTIENQLRKYSWDGSAWLSNGSIPASGCQNISGNVSGGTATLFLTSPIPTTGGLFKLVDSSGHNAALSGSLGAALITAGTNKAFRGISLFTGAPPQYEFARMAFAPGQVTVSWTGTPGVPPAIQVSMDLSMWSPPGLATETSSGIYEILDLVPDISTRRFYRIAP
jgi:hypothetical protein